MPISQSCLCHGCVHLESFEHLPHRPKSRRFYCLPKHHGYFNPNLQQKCVHRKTYDDIHLAAVSNVFDLTHNRFKR